LHSRRFALQRFSPNDPDHTKHADRGPKVTRCKPKRSAHGGSRDCTSHSAHQHKRLTRFKSSRSSPNGRACTQERQKVQEKETRKEKETQSCLRFGAWGFSHYRTTALQHFVDLKPPFLTVSTSACAS